MPDPSLPDRMRTRRTARALTSPVGIAAGVLSAVVALVVGLPVWAAVLVGAGVWALNLWRLLPRRPRRERIDPFTLHDPWRRFVQDALQARNRMAAAVHRAPDGPLRERLDGIAARVETAVEECWLVARRGETLVRARRGIDVAAIDRRLAQLAPAGGDAPDAAAAATVESLTVQRATAERLDGVIARAEAELRLLDARLDEAVARTLELSARAGSSATAVSGLGSDVEALVGEMEALRLALDEVGATGDGGGAGPAAPPDLPPGGTR